MRCACSMSCTSKLDNYDFTPFHAQKCFRHTCVYVFAMVAQSAMVFMLALDLLFAVVIPLRHHVISTLPYVFCMCVPPFLLALVTVISSMIFMNEEEISFCTPITAMPHEIEWLSYVINVLNMGVIVVLLSIVTLFGMNKRNTNNMLSVRGRQEVSRSQSQSSSSEELKMMRAFSIMMMVFVCSWCLAAITTHIALRYLRKELSLVVQTYTVIIALPTYCQCYFVSYVRSPHHRAAYHRQLRILFPCLFRNK
ncbi:hypothetical protein OSTOST_07846 [Ostertagia ostertagi]